MALYLKNKDGSLSEVGRVPRTSGGGFSTGVIGTTNQPGGAISNRVPGSVRSGTSVAFSGIEQTRAATQTEEQTTERDRLLSDGYSQVPATFLNDKGESYFLFTKQETTEDPRFYREGDMYVEKATGKQFVGVGSAKGGGVLLQEQTVTTPSPSPQRSVRERLLFPRGFGSSSVQAAATRARSSGFSYARTPSDTPMLFSPSSAARSAVSSSPQLFLLPAAVTTEAATISGTGLRRSGEYLRGSGGPAPIVYAGRALEGFGTRLETRPARTAAGVTSYLVLGGAGAAGLKYAAGRVGGVVAMRAGGRQLLGVAAEKGLLFAGTGAGVVATGSYLRRTAPEDVRFEYLAAGATGARAGFLSVRTQGDSFRLRNPLDRPVDSFVNRYFYPREIRQSYSPPKPAPFTDFSVPRGVPRSSVSDYRFSQLTSARSSVALPAPQERLLLRGPSISLSDSSPGWLSPRPVARASVPSGRFPRPVAVELALDPSTGQVVSSYYFRGGSYSYGGQVLLTQRKVVVSERLQVPSQRFASIGQLAGRSSQGLAASRFGALAQLSKSSLRPSPRGAVSSRSFQALRFPPSRSTRIVGSPQRQQTSVNMLTGQTSFSITGTRGSSVFFPRTTTPTTPVSITRTIPDTVVPPGLGLPVIPFGLPIPGGGGLLPGKSGRKRSFQYTPSLTAALYGITGSKPSLLGGFELRPLVKGA